MKSTSSTPRSSATRRIFLQHIAVASALAGGLSAARAQALVSESDPAAVGLGYKADASKVDKARYPKFAASQACSSCALYQGKAADAAGGCGIFPGKQVAAKGWCSAYAKKAA